MSDKVTAIAISVTPQASFDIERLDDFLWEQQDPLAGDLYAYLIKALRLLERQPGVGRPVGGDVRELIIDRGRSGYLARYQYQRDVQTVIVLRIRHQSESGYTLDEI
jgi:plasmid stabilization system protein ParE